MINVPHAFLQSCQNECPARFAVLHFEQEAEMLIPAVRYLLSLMRQQDNPK